MEANHEQLDLIEALLKTSTISPEKNEYISKRVTGLSFEMAEIIIDYLNEKQVNRIHAGLNYNAGYIKRHLKKSI